MKAMLTRHGLRAVLLLLALAPWRAEAVELWQTLPPTPAAVSGARSGHAEVNGIRLFYVDVGAGPPVVLLHGGLANSDYLADQARALARTYRVILVDSRGHGRSTRDGRSFSYDLMADDVVALLDTLQIDKAAIVGWSDGANIGLDMAMRYPRRVTRVFAFAANTATSGIKDDFERNPTVMAFAARAGREYSHLSPSPWPYMLFQVQMNKMWKSEPNWSDVQLRAIRTPVWVVAGEHDESIKRQHTEYIAATIPGARLMILPNVSHFAMLQDPAAFNTAILKFLGKPQPPTAAPKAAAKATPKTAPKATPPAAPKAADR
jgi:pimeloyl-ACP methyl ester carboxylesterase